MRPIEWLLDITTTRDGYERLMREAGGLCQAAWRLAQAQCMTRGVATHVPSGVEVRSAASRLARHLGLEHTPSSHELRLQCEALGLPVL